MRESMRSKSSTSCWKVGLRNGTACQQSLIIMYLMKCMRGANYYYELYVFSSKLTFTLHNTRAFLYFI